MATFHARLACCTKHEVHTPEFAHEKIRYHHFGEGRYEEQDAVGELLSERTP
jgi:hypothetical protein